MTEANDIIGMIYQNLLDAGYNKRTTEKYMVFVKNEEYQKLLPILFHFRISLLENVHLEQKKIDCLDYLTSSKKSLASKPSRRKRGGS